MADSILSSLLSQASLKITNSTTGDTVMSGIKTKSVKISYKSEPMRHMLEDGTSKIDTRVIRPTTVNIALYTPDTDALSSVQTAYGDRTTLYSITSKGLVFDNMQISGENIRQSSDMLSATQINLEFSERLVEGITPVVCENAANSSIIDRGISMLNSLESSATDLYSKVSGAISSGISQASALL